MSWSTARRMIAADILKLRRHRPTMVTAALLSVGSAILLFAYIAFRHPGGFAGSRAMSDGATLMGIYFGAFAAILIGAEAGAIDLANGVFRDLVVTGRSRITLFLVRIPAATVISLILTLAGFAVIVAAGYAFHGSAPAPSPGLALKYAAWVAVATIVQATLATGIASLTGSRSVTLVAVIGLNTIATTILTLATFLGPARDLILLLALDQLSPGQQVSTGVHPQSGSVTMPIVVAVLVVLAWAVIPAIAGAWRTRTQDA